MKKILIYALLCLFSFCALSESEGNEAKVLMDFSHVLGDHLTNAKTEDYGYCVQHSYEGDADAVKAVAESLMDALENDFGMEQVLYYVVNPFHTEGRAYDSAYLMTDHAEYPVFTMGGNDSNYHVSCHVYVRYTSASEGETSYVSIIHSNAFVCHEEILLHKDAEDSVLASQIEWYQMGASGKSFYYGQIAEDTYPDGFTVYESNQNSTYYGMNEGGFYKDMWDGTIVAVNRDGDLVNSVNLITYEHGNARHSVCYFRDGSIVYCTFSANKPVVRYTRQGNKLYMEQYFKELNWWSSEKEIPLDQMKPEWEMGYCEISLKADERTIAGRLHKGEYLLTGVTDEGETVEIMRLKTHADGSVECSLSGESWRYDYPKNKFETVF